MAVFVLLVAGVAIGLKFGVSRKTNWGNLIMENVEALATPEDENPYYPCVKAVGYCFDKNSNVTIKGVSLLD